VCVSPAGAVKSTQSGGSAAPALPASTTGSQQFTATEASPVTVTIDLGTNCPPAMSIDWGDASPATTSLTCDASGPTASLGSQDPAADTRPGR